MQARIDIRHASQGAIKAMQNLETYLASCSIEKPLRSLVKMRASQINGCAFCLDMHSKEARAEGESEQRLYVLDAWHEAPFFTDRERAALAWTEALTLVSQTHAPDEVYQEARRHFSETELVDLSLTIATINMWNRISIGFRAVPGTYHPEKEHVAA